MKRNFVTSSSIASVGYESKTRTLEVEFITGSVYQYFNVPQAVYEELIVADSIGAYVNQIIKTSYGYTKIS